MLGLWLVVAALILADQRDPPNRLEFVNGRVAGAIRMIDGLLTCVASVNGRSGMPGDQNICDILSNSGGYAILNRAGAGAQFEAVLSIRIDGTPTSALTDPGLVVVTMSARVTIRPDGSIATCREGPARIVNRVPGFRDVPPLCEIYPPSVEQVFTKEETSAAPRAARLDLGYYLRRP